MENTQERFDKFYELFTRWENEIRMGIRDTKEIAENIFEIRSGMKGRIEVPQVDMITYKRTIIKELEMDFKSVRDKKFAFTDAELEENRFATGEYAGRKITKVLTEIISEFDHYRNEQRLDYFNKLRRADSVYFIDSDPITLMDRYYSIQTCVSPRGDNQSNLVKFLFSPYVYIATDEHKSVRMVIYADFERKFVFLNPVYGSFDIMFPLSIVNYFASNGFTFVEDIHSVFDASFLSYQDRHNCSFLQYIRFFNAPVATRRSDDEYPKIDLFSRPSWVRYEGDGLVHNHHESDYTISFSFHDTGDGMRPDYQEYCSSCGHVVDSDNYDYDSESCYDCSSTRNYCHVCDTDHIHDYDYDFDSDMCNYCADRERQREENICVVCDNGFLNEDYDFDTHTCLDCVHEREDNKGEEEEEEVLSSFTNFKTELEKIYEK